MRWMWVSAVRSLITTRSAISRLVSLSNHHHNLALALAEARQGPAWRHRQNTASSTSRACHLFMAAPEGGGLARDAI